ncbi:MAG: hypothetical protein LW629_11515 [Burkholderiales bacterium]|nr:hypothetical protein [Burkholderiales bacterium]
MQKRTRLSGVLLAGFLLHACSTTVTDVGAYREVPMADAEVMPTPEQVRAGRTKVVVLDVDDQSVRGRFPDAGLLKARKLEEVLSEGGTEVVDRSLASRLRQELSLAEVQCTYIKATCAYSGNASGGIRVYELPSLRQVANFNLKGSTYSSEGGYCRNDFNTLGAVMRGAVEDAVYDNRVELKNLFAPKGYVSEKRILDRRVIFKVMLGRSSGVNPGDRVTFFTLRKKENRLTKKLEYEEQTLTTGVVSDKVADELAWVLPDDLPKAEQIRLGDYARVQYRKGFFD